ncbi:MAG: hypothetical protein AAF456_00895 [Planctomycetota bacterium]
MKPLRLLTILAASLLSCTCQADWFDDFELNQIGDPLSTLIYFGDYTLDSSVDLVGVGGTKGVLAPTPSWFGWPGAYRPAEPGALQIGDSVEVSVDMRFQIASNPNTLIDPVPVAELFMANSDWTTIMTAQFFLDGSNDEFTECGILRWDSGDPDLLYAPAIPVSDLGVTSSNGGELSDYFKLRLFVTKTGYEQYDTRFEIVHENGTVLSSLEETGKNLDHMFWSETIIYRFGHFGMDTHNATDFLHFDNFSACVTQADDYPVFVENAFPTRGIGAHGIETLISSDNSDYSISRNSLDVQSVTELEMDTTSPVANPTTLEVVLESSVFARSGVTQTIELYNFQTASWEVIDSRPASRFGDVTVSVPVSGDLRRFVHQGLLLTSARVRYQSLNNRQRFTSNIDRFNWVFSDR